MLSIEKIGKVYTMLEKHLPDWTPDGETIVQYVDELLDNMIKAGESARFIDVILIMHDMTLEELKDKKQIDIIKLFVSGFADNMVLDFKDFLVRTGL